MKKGLWWLWLFLWFVPVEQQAVALTAEEILKRVDSSLNVERQIVESSMIIHGIRGSREIRYQSWIVGQRRSFTEALAPARERGNKMLKLDHNLWIFDARADRTIMIAGHMLRQSMAGSDLSYEDMMERGKLLDHYRAEIVEVTELDERAVWVLHLQARNETVAYQTRKLWIDQERFIPLREELFAAGGKLLKRLETLEIFETSRGWYPKRMRFKDMLKEGQGTEFIVNRIDFDSEIPDSRFSKAALRR
jgi:outer membrane lipoprotein-sorting protein